jgi:hypothetical protein
LPPSIVLEVMKILEKEIALREQTRELDQAQEALTDQTYGERAGRLAETQAELSERIADVNDAIRQLPDGEVAFKKELALLTIVGQVMDEAHGLLDRPETGAETIAAETHVIELLMQARRIRPGGGGGGGATPGGGGGGDTDLAALALIGAGEERNRQPQDREVRQATGVSGEALPEEYRTGLDAFFQALEVSGNPGGA